jgi:hypothetical protein
MQYQNYFVYMLTNADRHTVFWSRAKKEALIARRNPEWRDLFTEMYALRAVRVSW